uniref:Reverse transcriptase domain-containing protein n=1 Tax=Tanacetum cinerariifolium TaxID=118510 RepID=A0A6L2MQ82_TANCI|nr:hypothetical protein [Tanacetum cinerariifolium]
MFTDERTLDYSSPLIFDVYDDDFLEVKSDAGNVYDDHFDSKGDKIKESKLLIDELDLPYDFLPLSEYDSFISQDFSRVDAFPLTNNEDKDRAFEIKDAFGNKQYKPKDIQELFRKLLNDLQNIHEELAEYINTPGWNRPTFYNDDDDDDVTRDGLGKRESV